MKKKLWILLALLLGLAVLSCCVGRYPLSLSQIGSLLAGGSSPARDAALFYDVRLPRIVLVVWCGGGLSLSGLVFQGLFRNPLVSPDVLGVAGGCSVGAVLAILFAGGQAAAMQAFPFAAGLGAVFLALGIARLARGEKTLMLIVAGIVVGSAASAILMALKYVADPNRQLPAIEYWLMGSFHNAGWENVAVICPLITAAGLVLFALRWQLKVLTLGDEEARSLGVNTGRVRLIAILCATVLVSTVVSVAGVVSWIGLIAPHVVRLFVGEDVGKTIPHAFLCGGILLLLADTLSRTVYASELPVSILTSLFGAAFLCWLLWRRRRAA